MADIAPVATPDQTDVGSYFVANYPPFSLWAKDAVVTDAQPALASVAADVPLGLYLHIPFCRKRCHFCYFRVYTGKNASEVQAYLDVLAREWELYHEQRAIAGRRLDFVYFGGGTPSFLSVRQLGGLVKRLKATSSWNHAEEITFECEPGTLTERKLTAIRKMGVTRLSLGVEHFDDHILEVNGRAHRSQEIFRAYKCAMSLDFSQINVDLIAGMLDDTDEKWTACIHRTIALAPDSVTIYQMELPFNTVYSRDMLDNKIASPVADWATKRDWVDYAMDEFSAAGYAVSSAYTMVKDTGKINFSYRDNVWRGADLLSTGVASFGHISGVHYQNLAEWDQYTAALLEQDKLPLDRAMRPAPHQLLIREMILQIKHGCLDAAYFREKFGVEIGELWRRQWQALVQDGMLVVNGDRLRLTRKGLLRVDSLLPAFFEPEHQGLRYT